MPLSTSTRIILLGFREAGQPMYICLIRRYASEERMCKSCICSSKGWEWRWLGILYISLWIVICQMWVTHSAEAGPHTKVSSLLVDRKPGSISLSNSNNKHSWFPKKNPSHHLPVAWLPDSPLPLSLTETKPKQLPLFLNSPLPKIVGNNEPLPSNHAWSPLANFSHWVAKDLFTSRRSCFS